MGQAKRSAVSGLTGGAHGRPPATVVMGWFEAVSEERDHASRGGVRGQRWVRVCGQNVDWRGRRGLMLLSPGRVSAGSGRQPVPGDDRLGRGGVALARGDCGSMVPELCNCAGLTQVVAAGAGRLTSGGRQPRPTAADGGRLCTRHCDGLWWSHARGRPCT